MADLNVALVLRLIDQMSAPLRKVKEALGGVKGETGQASDGLGKVTDGAKGAGTALKDAFGPHLPSQIDAMNRSAERSTGVFTRLGRNVREFGAGVHQGLRETLTVENYKAALEKNERDITAARGRLMGAAGMAMSLAGPIWAAGNFERDLITYGNLADMSRAKLAVLGGELDRLSRRDRTGMGKSELLAGLSTYVGKGLSHTDGVAALEATGRAAKATGASFDEMAAAGFAAMDNLKVTPQQLGKAFDIMAASGKEGSFELQDMARKFPELTASAHALGMKGEQGVASLAAALQIAMKSAGSADQAANNTVNFLGKLTSQDSVKKFADMGINIQKELDKAAKSGTDPLEHMLDVIARATGGDQFKMGELFADKQVLDFLRAAIPNLEEYRRIKQAAASAEGVVDRDYQNVMTGFNESVTQLKSSFVGLFSASGALLPALTDLVRTATGMVDALRDWTAANPELTAWLVKGAALMLTMGVASRVLGFAFAVARGNLIRFLAMFLKFNDAGRNISAVARLLRGLGRGFSWAKVIPRFAWSAVLSPLRWAAFAPKLLWSSLIGTLTWTSFIPRKLFLSDFGPGVTQIGPAMMKAATQTEAAAQRMRAAVTGLNFRALASGVQMLALASDAPSDPNEFGEWRANNDKALDEAMRNTWGVKQLMAGYERVFEMVHGKPPPQPGDQPAPPPVDIARRDATRAVLDAQGYGVPGSHPAARDYPFSPTFSQRELMQTLGTPTGGRAREVIRADQVVIQAPAAAGGLGAARPTPKPETAGLGAVRPAPKPEPVKIQETINHDYTANHKVEVLVQNHITKQYLADVDALAREVGLKTERATRRALSDAALPQ